MPNVPLNVKIIIGSTREGRFSEIAAQWVAEELAKREGITTEILDLREYPMPFFDNASSPAHKQAPYTEPVVARFTEKIREGDAFVMVTPEYSHSTSAVLKNALDWVYQEWNDKAVGFVSYGSVGGARAIEHLRLIGIELQMAPVREAVHVLGNDYFPTIFGGGDVQEMLAKYHDKAVIMVDQLLKWGRALKAVRG